MLLQRDLSFFAIPPGVLRLTRVEPNPDAPADCARYLLVGDATTGPITTLWPDEGAPLPAARPDTDASFRLKIVHFNDLHGQITHFSQRGAQPIFARMAGYIGDLRARYANHPRRGVLAFSAGDDSVGSVFDALIGDSPSSFQLHAAYRLYSAAGIDACALGNHDLDLGPRLLAQALLADARFPLLSANLAGCSWLSGLYFPAALYVVKGVRVAVIGLTTPGQIAPHPDSTLHLVDPIRVVQNLLPALAEISDVRIVLSHLGYSLRASSATVLMAGDVELAEALPPGSIHAIIGGHTHHALNEQGLSPHNIVNGIPIVQAGKLGEFVGEVDITVGRRCAAVTSVQLIPTRELPVDAAFEAAHVQPLVRAAQPIFEQVLGEVADDPDMSVDVVRNEFAADESALANFVADALVERCRLAGYPVDFAAIDATCISAGLPPGRLTYGDWFNVMPYADTVRICTITGAELQHLLCDNAQRADRPEEAHTERGFLHFSRAVRYRIRLGNTRTTATVTAATVDGRPLAEQQARIFKAACTSFMHTPAGAWEQQACDRLQMTLFDAHKLPKEDTRLFVRNETLAYIRDHGGVTPESGARRDGRLVVEE
jgi:2',3'-cyclic-nucleotide 2'-phosphodiesterase (5'-nucleotidase family)